MADEKFEAFVARERVRLTSVWKALKIQQRELEAKLLEIAEDLTALDAYETAYETICDRVDAAWTAISPPFDGPEL